jgi:hypothetical protein
MKIYQVAYMYQVPDANGRGIVHSGVEIQPFHSEDEACGSVRRRLIPDDAQAIRVGAKEITPEMLREWLAAIG